MFPIEEVRSILTELVGIDSTPEASSKQVLGIVEYYFNKHNVFYKKTSRGDDYRGALLARIGPDIEGGILLSGHLDVVSVQDQKWKTPPFVLTDLGDRYAGRGTCDMKGFVACVLSMIPYWQMQKLDHPIYIALTTDEETGNQTILDLIEMMEQIKKPSIAIIGEPTNLDIVTAHKGTHSFDVQITGRAAHSSRPDLGVNAIDIAHDMMSYIRALARDLKIVPREESMSPPYITVNIGTISGGTATNIIPEKCHFTWHLRQIINTQAEKIEKDFLSYVHEKIEPEWMGAKIYISTVHFPALEPRRENKSAKLVQRLLPNSQLTTAPFATEAGHIQKQNIDVVVCGPGSIEQAHKADEFILKSQLQDCLSFLGKITNPEAWGA